MCSLNTGATLYGTAFREVLLFRDSSDESRRATDTQSHTHTHIHTHTNKPTLFECCLQKKGKSEDSLRDLLIPVPQYTEQHSNPTQKHFCFETRVPKGTQKKKRVQFLDVFS